MFERCTFGVEIEQQSVHLIQRLSHTHKGRTFDEMGGEAVFLMTELELSVGLAVDVVGTADPTDIALESKLSR